MMEAVIVESLIAIFHFVVFVNILLIYLSNIEHHVMLEYYLAHITHKNIFLKTNFTFFFS